MDDRIDSLEHQIDQGMVSARYRLRQTLASLRQHTVPETDQRWSSLRQRIEQSLSERQRRQANLPKPTFDLDLPILARRTEIAEAIERNQVIVVCGETGSGKTTQLAKICLSLGRGAAAMIGHTQPRRIAARAVATRLAQELQSPLGQAVGYKIRFSDKLSENTNVKLMTDGILLAETQHDLFLTQYDTLIIDEAHERSLNIDFLLGYLKRLLPNRPDLKLIITSATIDPAKFSAHFDNAPIIEVSGRAYPVEVRYRPADPDAPEPVELPDAVAQAAQELAAVGPGDILVFLPGEREIRETAEALRKQHPAGAEILPLYARLSAAEQDRVFQPHAQRRIVLATNVAETSLTVPGVHYVIDSGIVRMSRYSARSKVQRLPIEPISRASAEQRKGRCGRVAAGVCIRLFSEEDFQSRPEYTDPEILRTNLASVILRAKALRLGAVSDFPFIQPPDYRMIRDGFQTLHELGAIDENNELTAIGQHLSRLPIDPRIGRMVLEAAEQDCLDEVLVIAAGLSVQDPRERPIDKAQQADAAHAQFRDSQSDFLSLLKLWRAYHASARQLSRGQLRKWCLANFLSLSRMREWADIHRQLLDTVAEIDLRRRGRRPGKQAPATVRTRPERRP